MINCTEEWKQANLPIFVSLSHQWSLEATLVGQAGGLFCFTTSASSVQPSILAWLFIRADISNNGYYYFVAHMWQLDQGK